MQLLVFVLVYPFLWVVSVLPHPIFYGLSDIFFTIVYHIVRYRRKVVQGNLALAFPNWDQKEIKRVEKAFYRHLCDSLLETIKTMGLTKAQIKRKYEVINLELIKELEQERSILVVFAHYANWEWSISINNYLRSKGYGVYQKISNPYFDRLIRRVRAKWNTTLITQQQTAKTVMKDKKNGIIGVFGMVSDQSPQRHRAQYWSNFMGIKVPVFNGAETMARKLGLAVVFLKVSKVKRGHYRAEIIPIANNGRETAPGQITETFLRLTEAQIREKPEHYLWTHRRWKHRGKQPAPFAKVV